ncbi:MAG: hypothetical protein JNL87_13970 [Burkholderiaceae bacterium]|nr:hypothetical protein [Burkholderiaceae bacterium]
MSRVLLLMLGLLGLWFAPPAPCASDEAFTYEAATRGYPASAPAPAPALDPRDHLAVEYQRSQDSTYLTITFVVSGVAVAFMLLTLLLSTRQRQPLSGRDVLRAAVVIFIAYGAIVLALAYPKDQTMTGVIGILGAIAGYVFGRSGSDDRSDASKS